jgi:hypothetical protein
VAVLVAAGTRPAAAHAASAQRLCADRVSVWDSPDGFVVAHVFRPQRMRVLATTDHRHWSLVHFEDVDLRGWILSRAICR